MEIASDIYFDIFGGDDVSLLCILIKKTLFSFIVFIDRHYFYDYI